MSDNISLSESFKTKRCPLSHFFALLLQEIRDSYRVEFSFVIDPRLNRRHGCFKLLPHVLSVMYYLQLDRKDAPGVTHTPGTSQKRTFNKSYHGYHSLHCAERVPNLHEHVLIARPVDG